MKREMPGPAADERLERLLDEDLRAIARPAGVDLRARVAAALARVPGSEPGVRESGFRAPASGFQLPRWTFGLAAAAVILLAVVAGWRVASRVAPHAAEPSKTAASRPPAKEPAVAERPGPAGGAPTGAGESRVPVVTSQRRRLPNTHAPDGEPATVPVDAFASAEPYLPGAPAGELGDPLQPLPSPPPITFVPIASAPPVSESARPVTDFPADNPAPGVPAGTTGYSGGFRR